MSILSRLFGGKSEETPKTEAVPYHDFRIYPEPIAEGSLHRICARIEKDFGDETRTETIIRSDTLQSRDDAVAASVRKAKQVIEEQGDRLFG